MVFRYFDETGRQLTVEELRSMRVATPTMDHVFATALERLEMNSKQLDAIENRFQS